MDFDLTKGILFVLTLQSNNYCTFLIIDTTLDREQRLSCFILTSDL